MASEESEGYRMKTIEGVFVFLTVSTLSAIASAQAPSADKGPEAQHPRSDEISVGYQIELGASTTHVVRGASQGGTKTTPSLEDLAILRFDNLGKGKLSVGSTFAMPFAGPAGQPEHATSIYPSAIYQRRLGPLQGTVGFVVKLYPNADVVDGQYEGVVRVALPNRLVSPFVEVYPEVVRRRGVYTAAGLERELARGPFSLRPRVLVGAQSFAESHESFHANEATVMLPARVKLGSGLYAKLTPAYSVLIGPDRYVKDASWPGRSVAYAVVGVGVER